MGRAANAADLHLLTLFCGYHKATPVPVVISQKRHETLFDGDDALRFQNVAEAITVFMSCLVRDPHGIYFGH
ncbi:hypothetical protein CCMA1212_004672 [Trichoderma ghanense]|uniref:Uncharacterized protein n=1 Tax=Trichoderma ghanense TaxID=65468 RepID=A0ABY2H527_9HYPO